MDEYFEIVQKIFTAREAAKYQKIYEYEQEQENSWDEIWDDIIGEDIPGYYYRDDESEEEDLQ